MDDRAGGRTPKTWPPGRAIFSEAIVTGPAAMLAEPANPNRPPSCAHLTGVGHTSGSIQTLSVPRLGVRSWAYRVISTGPIPVWQWVEVVQAPRYVLEVRIPNQAPAPGTDPVRLLPRITRSAYERARHTL